MHVGTLEGRSRQGVKVKDDHVYSQVDGAVYFSSRMLVEKKITSSCHYRYIVAHPDDLNSSRDTEAGSSHM